jgi:mono/diheme cytochrome c family protein
MRKAITLAAALVFVAAFSIFSLPTSTANDAKRAARAVTFNKDVAPIFFKNCAECHRTGEAAPFSVMTYKEARPWARSIKEKVVTREMPPWHADPNHGEWSNDRRLKPAEVETIAAWVDQGAREGDSKDLPPAPRFIDGWQIGKPDVVLQMPEEFTLAASGPDEYQYFEIPTNFKEDRWVQFAEARPGNRKVVHHIIAFIQPPAKGAQQHHKFSKEEIEKFHAEREKKSIFYRDGFLMRTKANVPVFDDGCAIENGGSGDNFEGTKQKEQDFEMLAGYAPGMNQTLLEPGIAKKLPAGATIILQLHYSKVAGEVVRDRSMVGLVFAKELPDKDVFTRPVSNNYFKIPAGADRHKTTACWTTTEDIHIVNLMPHMHVRGVAMEIKAFYPDGRSEVLLNVPNYSFSWQTVYYLRKPAPIPKGTKILVTGYFDNSAKNKHNPDPKKDVRWGEPTYDEMMIGWINYTIDSQHLRATDAGSGMSKK